MRGTQGTLLLLLAFVHARSSRSWPQVSILSGGSPLEPENSIEHASDMAGWLEEQPIVRLSALSGHKQLFSSFDVRNERLAKAKGNEHLVVSFAPHTLTSRASPATTASKASNLSAIQARLRRLEDQNRQLTESVKTLVQKQKEAEEAEEKKQLSRIQNADEQHHSANISSHSSSAIPDVPPAKAATKTAPKPPPRLPVITSWVEPPPPPPPKNAYPIPTIKQVPRGIHLTLKPHELPEWGDDKNGVANHYIDLLEQIMDTVHTRNSEINVMVDVPAS